LGFDRLREDRFHQDVLIEGGVNILVPQAKPLLPFIIISSKTKVSLSKHRLIFSNFSQEPLLLIHSDNIL
jgi:hypothetical protein